MAIDLDAARAARAEAHGETETVVFGGETFELPPECPYSFIEAANTDQYTVATIALLGEAAAARFLATVPVLTVDDYKVLVFGIAKHYGLGSPGNSPASNGSSPNGSRRSKRTS